MVTSIVISAIVIFGAWRLIRDSVNVLLEGTPSHINLRAVELAILQNEKVVGVHDLHVWTITSGMEALSVHVVHREGVEPPGLLRNLRKRLYDDFGIDHLTIQMEKPVDEQAGSHECFSGANCFEAKTGK